MAENVEIKYTGDASDLFAVTAQIGKDTRALGTTFKEVQEGIQEDLVSSGEEAKKFGKNVAEVGQLIVALSKSATGGLPVLSKNLKEVSDLTAKIKTGLSAADKTNLNQINTALREVAKNEKVIIKDLGVQKQARINLLVETNKLTAEEGQLLSEVQAVVDTLKEVAAVPVPVEKVQSLRAAYLAAKREAETLSTTPGPEFDAALAEAARLKELLDDTRDSIQALNPQDKVQAFSALGNAVAGGAQAVSGFAIALGGQNQELQEALFKFQSILFAVQGAQTFLKDFQDSFENVKRVIGLTTAVQEASTVATEVDIVAKEGQVVANTAAATSTNVLAVAIRGLQTALASGPLIILAVVAAIALLAVAIVNMGDDAEDTTTKFDRLSDRLDRAIQRARVLRGIQSNKEAIDAETRAIQGQGTAEEQRRAIQLKGLQDVRRATEENLDAVARRQLAVNRILQLGVDIARARAESDVSAIAEISTKQQEAAKELMDLNLEVQESNAAVTDAQRRNINSLAEFDKQNKAESLERAKQLAEQTLAIQETLAANILSIEKEIQEQISALEIEQADPRERVALERAAAEEQIALEERNLQRFIALQQLRVQIGTEAFQKLTEAQKQARADAIIDAGGVELSLQDEQRFAALRLLNEVKFGNELAEILKSEAEARVELLKDGQEKERVEFEFDLQRKIEALRAAKATEQEVLAFEDEKRAEFTRAQNEKAIALDIELQTALIESRSRGAETEKEFERRKQLDLLAIKIAAAEASLALVEEDGTKETAVRRAQIQATIQTLTTEFQKLKDSPLDLNLLDLLGIAPEDQARVREAMSSILQSTREIFSAGIQARQQEVQAAIAATDAIIEDAQRRRTELQAELDQALDDQREGYANNQDAIRAQIEQTKQVEAEALEEKKRQIAEQRKLARQQILVDSATQGSALLLSTANLIKTWSTLPFGIGLISAFAQAAQIVAFFTSTKTKLASASNTPSFRKGGKHNGILVGPRHNTDGSGGIAIMDRRTGYQSAWAEGGEYFVNREATKRFEPLLHAANEMDMGRVHEEATKELRRVGKVVLDARELRKMVSPMISARSSGDMHGMFKALSSEMSALREEVAMFRRQEGGKPSTTKQGGKTVTSTPGHKVISR